MDEREKKINSKCIARFANANTQRHWAQSFLSIIEHHEVSRNQTNSSENYGLTQHLNPKLIFEAYDSVDGPRLILLDYDGTISPIKMTPSAAVPSVRTIESLRMLAADSRNLVYVISGRDQTTLTTWLGSIHGLTLVAEHGTFIRINGSTDWQPTNPIVDESGKLEPFLI